MTLDALRHLLAMRQRAGERLTKREREFLCGLRPDPFEDAEPGTRIADIERATTVQFRNGSTLTFQPTEDQERLRSSDGQRIAYTGGRAGRFCAEP